jgi:hypothetical protein
VTYICNPSYLGGGDRETQGSGPARVPPPISKLGVVVHACNFNYSKKKVRGSRSRGKKHETLSENN